MIKQIILIILLSLVAIFLQSELSRVLDGLVSFHHSIDNALHTIFSQGNMGRIIQDVISLLIIPFAAGFLLTSLFWLVKRTAMPHTMAVVWILWLILLVAMLAQNHLEPKTIQPAVTPHENIS